MAFFDDNKPLRWHKLMEYLGLDIGPFNWGEPIENPELHWLCWFVCGCESWDVYLTQFPEIMRTTKMDCETVARKSIELLSVLGDRPEAVISGLRWVYDKFGPVDTDLKL